MIDKIAIILSFFFSIIQTSTVVWTPEDLSDYVKSNYPLINPNNTPYIFIDPNEYTTETEKTKLLSQMEYLYTMNNTPVTFIVIENMTTAEQRDFINRFNASYYTIDTSNYVTVFFAMGQRKSRVATGKNSRNVYSDSWCTKMLSELSANLKNKDYYSAYSSALDYLIHQEKIGGNNSNLPFIVIFYTVFGILCFLIICMACSKFKGRGSSRGDSYDNYSSGGGDFGGGDFGGGGDGSW